MRLLTDKIKIESKNTGLYKKVYITHKKAQRTEAI